LVVEIYRRDADQTSGLERSLYEHACFASEADGLNEFDLAQGRAAKTEQSWLCTLLWSNGVHNDLAPRKRALRSSDLLDGGNNVTRPSNASPAATYFGPRLADYCSGFLHVTRSSYFAGTAAQ
jgi:hypothetical protein